MVMADDPEFNISFVGIVKKYPCLYNYRDPMYSNRTVHDAAWESVAKEIGKSKQDCKERWKNLRGCYSRHLKYISTPGNKLKKSYYLAEDLEFLKPFTKTRKSWNNISRPSSITSETIVKEEFELNDFDSDSDNTQNEKDDTQPVEENSENLCLADSTPRKIKKRKKCTALYSEIDRAALEYFRSKKIAISEKRSEDADLAFFTSVLPDMKMMNSDQKRRFKIGILNLAGEIINE